MEAVCAGFLSAGAAFFTASWLTLCGFVMLQIIGHVYEGGELVFVRIFLTAPPVLLITMFALLLVGPRRCKVAWIFALLYLSPLLISLVAAAIAAVLGSSKL
jgi:hypothetical protein